MDDTRFDRLARALGGASSRRAGLKAALGGLLALAAPPAPDGEAKRKHKKKRYTPCPALCPSGSACVNGVCTCTRPLCGGICCGSDRTSCENGRCVYTGMRNCDGVAIVDGADLSFCDLRDKTIKTRTLKNANFDGADLSGASLNYYFQPWGCSFRGAKLVGADLDECDIKPGTSFAGADMRGAYLRAGHIDGADFSSANLTKAIFVGDYSWSEPTKIANSTFVRTNLSDATLYRVTIHGSNFTNALMAETLLGRAGITNSVMSGAMLEGAFLRGVEFVDTVLDGANLDRVYLGDSTFVGNVRHTRFTRCSMADVSLKDPEQLSWDEKPTTHFKDVDLRRAVFAEPLAATHVTWLRTDLTGAWTWKQPAGGYRYLCDVTLPDGTKAPDTGWVNGAACPRS